MQAQEEAKKEGKKKLGYLKRQAQEKQLAGKLTLEEPEEARRAATAELLAALKQIKEHNLVLRENVGAVSMKHLPAIESLMVLANHCPSDAKALCMQVLGGCRAMSNSYVEAILRDITPELTECGASIDKARSAKEMYYDKKLAHDQALLKLQDFQNKTDGIKPEKLEKHQKAMDDAKTKWIIATNEYDRSEATCSNEARTAVHAKGCADISVAQKFVAAALADFASTLDTLGPASASIDDGACLELPDRAIRSHLALPACPSTLWPRLQRR